LKEFDMKSTNTEFGLVLVGGGAKGAYQAGAVEFIAGLELKPNIIAGTSIGALNGAVLSSYGSFSNAAVRLNKLWDDLGRTKILSPSEGVVSSSIFDPKPIEEMLRQAVNPEELRRGIELWVTVFPSLDIPGLNSSLLINLFRVASGTNAEWLRVRDFPDDETVYNLLLASAAIPWAFPSREINGQSYVDGGLKDNIPVGALARRGCKNVIVIHLGYGTAWSRHDFPEQTIIEIRPEKAINQSDTPLTGPASSLLDFSAERIAELKKRGYEDAERCLTPIIQAFEGNRSLRESSYELIDSTNNLLNDSPLL
jgi:NTE family protein